MLEVREEERQKEEGRLLLAAQPLARVGCAAITTRKRKRTQHLLLACSERWRPCDVKNNDAGSCLMHNDVKKKNTTKHNRQQSHSTATVQ